MFIQHFIAVINQGNLEKCKHFLAIINDTVLKLSRITEKPFSVTEFINSGDEQGKTPLMWAAEKGHIDIVNYLLEEGGDYSAKDKLGNTLMHFAARTNKTVVIQRFLPKKNKGQSEVKSIFEKQIDICNEPNIAGKTPLHVAAGKNHVSIISLLLAHGAKIDAEDQKGQTPLVIAVRSCHVEAASCLLEAKANFHAKDGNSMVHIGAAVNSKEEAKHRNLLDRLLRDNPDLEARNGDHHTPLMVAATPIAAKFFLEKGANPLARFTRKNESKLSSACTDVLGVMIGSWDSETFRDSDKKQTIYFLLDYLRVKRNNEKDQDSWNAIQTSLDQALFDAMHNSCSAEIIEKLLNVGANLFAMADKFLKPEKKLSTQTIYSAAKKGPLNKIPIAVKRIVTASHADSRDQFFKLDGSRILFDEVCKRFVKDPTHHCEVMINIIALFRRLNINTLTWKSPYGGDYAQFLKSTLKAELMAFLLAQVDEKTNAYEMEKKFKHEEIQRLKKIIEQLKERQLQSFSRPIRDKELNGLSPRSKQVTESKDDKTISEFLKSDFNDWPVDIRNFINFWNYIKQRAFGLKDDRLALRKVLFSLLSISLQNGGKIPHSSLDVIDILNIAIALTSETGRSQNCAGLLNAFLNKPRLPFKSAELGFETRDEHVARLVIEFKKFLQKLIGDMELFKFKEITSGVKLADLMPLASAVTVTSAHVAPRAITKDSDGKGISVTPTSKNGNLLFGKTAKPPEAARGPGHEFVFDY